MDKDLDFLIKALSVSSSPLWSSFSKDQLSEMRESFRNLQELLLYKPELLQSPRSDHQQQDRLYQQQEKPQQHQPKQRHQQQGQQQSYPERFKAGGTCKWRNQSPVGSAAAAAAADVEVSAVLPPASCIEKSPATASATPTPSTTSSTPACVTNKLTKTSLTSVFTVPEMPTEWMEVIRSSDSSEICESMCGTKSEVTPESAVGQGDSSTSNYDENYLALVPYTKTETSQELVVFDSRNISEDYDDFDSFDDDSDHSDDGDSHTLREGHSSQSTSLVSLRIPVQMEYVWYNEDFQATSVESDMTLIADGLNFIISR